jgi:hypothetical protein
MMAVAMCGLAGPACAETWAITPTLTLQSGVSDNVRLREEDTDLTVQGSAAVGAMVERVTEIFQLRATGTAGYTAYGGDPNAPDDGDFQTLQGELGYQRERSVWRLTGTFFRDLGIVDAAVPENRIDPGADIDPATLEETVRRYRASLSPSFTRALTERLTAGAGYTVSYLSYDDPALEDSSSLNHELELRSDWAYDERTVVGIAAIGGLFRPEDEDRGFNTYGVLGEMEYQWSERSSVVLSAGMRWSNPAVDDDAESESGFLGGIEATTEGENWELSASLDRRLRPSARGVLKETDQLLLSGTRELSPRFSAELTGRVFTTRTVGRGESGTEDYASITPGISYRLTEEWSLTAEYQFQAIERTGADERAEDNAVFLRLDYEPLRERPGF